MKNVNLETVKNGKRKLVVFLNGIELKALAEAEVERKLPRY